MGYQVIRQPDARLALFSTFSDTLIMVDATPEDVVGYFVDRAAADARRSAERTVEAVVEGRPVDVYYQFAMTWDEALAMHDTHGGEPIDQFREVKP